MKTTKEMKTQMNNQFAELVKKVESQIAVCEKKIYYFEHPEECGFGIFKCNSIVINKERMLVVKVGDDRCTCHEFAPLYPTKFSPEAAQDIVNNDKYYDGANQRISLEIIGEKEYYYLLKVYLTEGLQSLKKMLA